MLTENMTAYFIDFERLPLDLRDEMEAYLGIWDENGILSLLLERGCKVALGEDLRGPSIRNLVVTVPLDELVAENRFLKDYGPLSVHSRKYEEESRRPRKPSKSSRC